jgi:hypothetical protein
MPFRGRSGFAGAAVETRPMVHYALNEMIGEQ